MRLLITTLFMAVIATAHSQNWAQLDNYISAGVDDGCSFTINGVAYCGTGRDAGFAVTPNFHAFDFATEQWSMVGAMPFAARRQYAAAEAYNSEGYVFGGINNQGDFLSDLWRYDPAMNSWDYLGQGPFEGRAGMQSFVIQDTLYIVGGRTAGSDAVNEVWGYDFTTAMWSMKNDMPNEGIWRGLGVEYNDIGIAGMGSDSLNTKRGEIYFYDAAADSWTEMAQIETEPMNYPAASVINDRLLIYGGEDTLGVYRNDFRYLDLINLTWNSLTSFPQDARRGVMVFSSSSDFFITTGLTTTQRLDETWVARSVASVDEISTSKELAVYVIDGRMLLSEDVEKCTLFNSIGQLIPLTSSEPGQFRLPEGLPPGVYYFTAHKDGIISSGKLVIQ